MDDANLDNNFIGALADEAHSLRRRHASDAPANGTEQAMRPPQFLRLSSTMSPAAAVATFPAKLGRSRGWRCGMESGQGLTVHASSLGRRDWERSSARSQGFLAVARKSEGLMGAPQSGSVWPSLFHGER